MDKIDPNQVWPNLILLILKRSEALQTEADPGSGFADESRCQVK